MACMLLIVACGVGQRPPLVAAHAPIVLECVPKWAKDSNGTYNPLTRCPYGKSLPFDVTFSKHWDEKAPYFHVALLLGGCTPAVLVSLAVLEFILRRGTRHLFVLCFLLHVILLNEYVWKRIYAEPRPEKSCNVTCGMPSSHAAVTVGMFVFLFLDLAFRVNPLSPHVLHDFEEEKPNRLCSCRRISWDMVSLLPLSNRRSISNSSFIRMSTFWFFVLVLYTPATRVLLADHSVEQVLAGMFIGFLEAIPWFFAGQRLANHYRTSFGRRWPKSDASEWYVLRHDMILPTEMLNTMKIGGDLRRAKQVIARELEDTIRELAQAHGRGLAQFP